MVKLGKIARVIPQSGKAFLQVLSSYQKNQKAELRIKMDFYLKK